MDNNASVSAQSLSDIEKDGPVRMRKGNICLLLDRACVVLISIVHAVSATAT